MSHNGDAHQPPPHSRLIRKLEESDGTLLCLIVASCKLVSSVCNFHVFLLSDDGFTSKEITELVTGTMVVAICYPYILLKWHELILLNLTPLKSWVTWCPNVRIFRDTVVLVIISYLLLLDINSSFVSLAIFPIMAITFIGALYFKLNRCTGDIARKVTPQSSMVDENTIKTPMELEIIVVVTFGALLVMDQLDDGADMGFAFTQSLLFLSSIVAALTRMTMKLPPDPFPGSAPASELLRKTLLLLLLVTAHTLAAEWLGEDVVLFCMPEVAPVLLWYSLHLDRPHHNHNPIISVDKMKPHMKGLIALSTLVVFPLFAYIVSSMDVSGLSWCTRIMVSCGVSGVLTYYLVFMLRYWHWPWQKEAAASGSSKDDVPSSGMLKFLADALLITAALLLLLSYMVSVRLGLQP
ncbi:unnamed protein product [Triticum turgidum subsp. durum]|uniref:Uncharacterized protein n=1 Tax=Triticum turgidum subsp. durum TaxID=4567 RepID=A0A9R1Q4T8_TRITD|nr:unnamed protein product [Triticum turgidum subsp. durum]